MTEQTSKQHLGIIKKVFTLALAMVMVISLTPLEPAFAGSTADKTDKGNIFNDGIPSAQSPEEILTVPPEQIGEILLPEEAEKMNEIPLPEEGIHEKESTPDQAYLFDPSQKETPATDALGEESLVPLVGEPLFPETYASNERFQFEVTVNAGDTFYVPTSGFLNNSRNKSYRWKIDWGDETSGTYSNTSNSDGTAASANTETAEGIPHTYATAQTYTITLTPNGSLDAWLGSFGFWFSSTLSSAHSKTNKDKLTKVVSPLTSSMTRTAAQIANPSGAQPDYEWGYTFCECSNLTMDDIFTLPQDITKVGNRFASGMFYLCTNLTMGTAFNLPQNITSNGNLFATSMFYYCKNLTMNSVFNLPPNITTAGNNFADSMFWGCDALTMNDSFNLPQNLTSADNLFAYRMFIYCPNLTMNSVFNLPQNLTTAGTFFGEYLFSGCTNLTMNSIFNLPPSLTKVKNDFAYGMFCRCTNLTMNDVFNLPQNLTSVDKSFTACLFLGCSNLTMNSIFNLPQNLTTVEDNFVSSLFHSCPKLTMNSVFNLPQNLTEVGDGFVSYLFEGCTNLTMNPTFTFPQTLTTVGNTFAYWMFRDCPRLTMNSVFNLPQNLTTVGNWFAFYLFQNCTDLTMNDTFNLPQNLTAVGHSFAAVMFYNCPNLTMNAVFNLPQNLTTIDTHFAQYLFCYCTKLTVNSVFKFPTLTSSELNKDYAFHYTFAGIFTSQTRTAASLINAPEGLNSSTDYYPSSARYTFSSAFSDQPFIHPNWGGFGNTPPVISTPSLTSASKDTAYSFSLEATGSTPLAWSLKEGSTLPQGLFLTTQGLISGTPVVSGTYTFTVVVTNCNGFGRDEKEFSLFISKDFQFQVSTNSPQDTFLVPTSGSLTTLWGKPYNWNIDWGDETSGTYTDTTNSDGNAASPNGIKATGIPHTYTTAGTYIITISPNGSTDAWLAAFGFYVSHTDANAQSNRDKITSVISPLTSSMTRTAAQIANPSGTQPSYEWTYTFYGCTNLTMSDIFTMPQDITKVGNCFAQSMFYGCSNDALTMGSAFNLPQNLTEVSGSFACALFSRCSGAAFTMNNVFNLPPGITRAGDFFAHGIFFGCSGAAFTMNETFTLPQNLTTAGIQFASSLFENCSGTAFTMNKVFNFPPNLTSVGDWFAQDAFKNCSGNAFAMNDIFTLPSSITSVGCNFAFCLFSGCSGSMFTMNTIFNLPSNLTVVGDFFAASMFYGCSGKAFTMNEIFTLPQGITSVGKSFLQEMFLGCSNSKFQINAVFKFPSLAPSELNKAAVYLQVFENIKTPQARTATSIINAPEGLNPLTSYYPPSKRCTFVFSTAFSDFSSLHTNWHR